MSALRTSLRGVLLLLAGISCVPRAEAQRVSTVYVSVISSGAFVVGAANSRTGLFYQDTDSDTTWKHTGPTRIRANGFAVDQRTKGRTLYIAAGNGVLRSTDAGVSWRVLTDWRVTEALSIALDAFHAGRMFIGTAYGVFASADDGATWIPMNKGRKAPFFTSCIVMDPLTRDRLYCSAEDGVYRSDDAGLSWVRIGLGDTAVRTVVPHPSRRGVLAAGTENNGLHVSGDGGRTWKKCADLGHDTWYAIAFDPSHPSTIYAGGYQTGVYASRDDGRSWSQSVKGLAVTTVHAIAVDPLDPRRLYAGTIWGGMFRSRDAGETWEYAGLMDSQAVCVKIHAF